MRRAIAPILTLLLAAAGTLAPPLLAHAVTPASVQVPPVRLPFTPPAWPDPGVTWRKDALGNLKGSDGTLYRKDSLGNMRGSNSKSGKQVTWRKDSLGNLRASDGTVCRTNSLGQLRCDGQSTPPTLFEGE